MYWDSSFRYNVAALTDLNTLRLRSVWWWRPTTGGGGAVPEAGCSRRSTHAGASTFSYTTTVATKGEKELSSWIGRKYAGRASKLLSNSKHQVMCGLDSSWTVTYAYLTEGGEQWAHRPLSHLAMLNVLVQMYIVHTYTNYFEAFYGYVAITNK